MNEAINFPPTVKACRHCQGELKDHWTVCPQCGKIESAKDKGHILAGILLGLGLAGLIYFFFLFDVGFAAGTADQVLGVDRVANLDLMNQRTNGMIFSAAVFLSGIIVGRR